MFSLHRYLPQHTRTHSSASSARRRRSSVGSGTSSAGLAAAAAAAAAAASAAVTSGVSNSLDAVLSTRCSALASDYVHLEGALATLREASRTDAGAVAPSVVAHVEAGSRLLLLALQHLATAEEQMRATAMDRVNLAVANATAAQVAAAAATAAMAAAAIATAAARRVSAIADVAGLMRRNSTDTLFPSSHSASSLKSLGEAAAAERAAEQSSQSEVLDISALRPDPDAVQLAELDDASLERSVARMRARGLEVWTMIDARLSTTQPWGRAITRVAESKLRVLTALGELLDASVRRGREAARGGVLELEVDDFIDRLNDTREELAGVHQKEIEIFVHALIAAADDAGVPTAPQQLGVRLHSTLLGMAAIEFSLSWKEKALALQHAMACERLTLERFGVDGAGLALLRSLALRPSMVRNESSLQHFLESVLANARSADPTQPLSAIGATEAVLRVLDRRAASDEDAGLASFFASASDEDGGGSKVELIDRDAMRGRLNPMVLELASTELKTAFTAHVVRSGVVEISTRLVAPDAMMRCVLHATELVANALRVASTKDQQVGADEFLPAFIAVVVHASLTGLVLTPRAGGGYDGSDGGSDGGARTATCLLAQLEYIDRLRDPASLMGSEGYVLASLRTAAEVLLRHALVFAEL